MFTKSNFSFTFAKIIFFYEMDTKKVIFVSFFLLLSLIAFSQRIDNENIIVQKKKLCSYRDKLRKHESFAVRRHSFAPRKFHQIGKIGFL